MKTTRAAKRYAKALVDLSIQEKALDSVEADLQSLSAILAENESLVAVLEAPTVSNDKKRQILESLLPKAHALIGKLFALLEQNKRMALLGAIIPALQELVNTHQGEVVASVVTAVPLNDQLSKQILAKAQQLVGEAKVILKNQVNPEIQGGFVLRVGDLQYDASIQTQKNRLKQALINE